MNAAEVCREELTEWSRKMGFLLSDGKVPESSYFMEAANLPCKRKLMNTIIQTVTDRRHVRKVRHELSSNRDWFSLPNLASRREGAQRRLEERRRMVAEKEQILEACFRKTQQRIFAMRELDETEKEIRDKMFLLYKHKMRRASLIKWAQRNNQALLQLNEQRNTSNLTVQDWLDAMHKETVSNWCNPSFEAIIRLKVSEVDFSVDMLWTGILIHYGQTIALSSAVSFIAQAAFDNFRKTAHEPLCNLLSLSGPQCIRTEVNNSLSFLLGSQQSGREVVKFLKRQSSAQVPEPDAAFLQQLHMAKSMQEASANIATITLPEDLDDLKRAMEEAESSKDALNQEVADLRERHKASSERVMELKRTLKATNASWSLGMRNDAASWEATCCKCVSSSRAFTHLLLQRPLEALGLAHMKTISRNAEIKGEDELKKALTLKVEMGVEIRKKLEALSPVSGIDKKDETALLERKMAVSLEKAQKEESATSQIIENLNRSLKLLSQRPFGEYIPDSVMAGNFTYQELQLQRNLNVCRGTSNEASFLCPKPLST